MKTPRNLTKNTRWVHTNHKKITLNHFPKRLKPTEASLFDLLPTVILAYIDIWVSGLEHSDKFKAVVKRIDFMSNPIIFKITHELWKLYYNVRVYIWYIEGFNEWAHMRISSYSHYQYYINLSTGITKLPPALIQSHELAVTFQHIAWDKNSSVPYPKQKILVSYEE